MKTVAQMKLERETKRICVALRADGSPCGTVISQYHSGKLCSLHQKAIDRQSDLNGVEMVQLKAGQFLTRFGSIRDRWSKFHDACVDCGKTDTPHEARGRCMSCSVAFRARQYADTRRERDRARKTQHLTLQEL